jgi:hypothetical protein
VFNNGKEWEKVPYAVDTGSGTVDFTQCLSGTNNTAAYLAAGTRGEWAVAVHVYVRRDGRPCYELTMPTNRHLGEEF